MSLRKLVINIRKTGGRVRDKRKSARHLNLNEAFGGFNRLRTLNVNINV